MTSLALCLTVAAAALLAFGLTAAIRPVLTRHAIAKPNHRSSHVVPTPQGAGVAVVIATLVVAAVAVALTDTAGHESIPIVFAATLVLAVAGAADDLRPAPVLPRLAIHALAVGAVLLAAPDARLVPACPLWLERGVLLVAGIWFVNLVNFMDGLDWMTVAETVPVTGALAALGLAGGLPPAVALTMAALGGAMIGFAPFNRPVAKLFLGDVGSLPIGLLLGWALLELALHGHLAAAVLLPLYYLADATVTLMRRALKGEAVWVAHRTHFYQRATDNGFTVPEVIAAVFGLNLVLAALAAASLAFPATTAQAILLILGLVAVAAVMTWFGRSRRPAVAVRHRVE